MADAAAVVDTVAAVVDTAVVEAGVRTTPVVPGAVQCIWEDLAADRTHRGSVPRTRDLPPRDPRIRVRLSVPARRRVPRLRSRLSDQVAA